MILRVAYAFWREKVVKSAMILFISPLGENGGEKQKIEESAEENKPLVNRDNDARGTLEGKISGGDGLYGEEP